MFKDDQLILVKKKKKKWEGLVKYIMAHPEKT